MPTTIRLMRIGKKGSPSYRIVAIDKRKKRNGRYLEKIGFYNPLQNPPVLQVDKKKLDYWLQKGATISEGIRKLKLQPRKSAKIPA